MNITDLVTESHDRAVRKGFYDPPPSIEQRLCLIHSEVSESVEAYRDRGLETWFRREDDKPEGVGFELADVAIRIADFMGSRSGLAVGETTICQKLQRVLRVDAPIVTVKDVTDHASRNLAGDFFQLHALIHKSLGEALPTYWTFWEKITRAFADTCGAAGVLGIDLEGCIRIKSDFNETRPHKHSKAF